MSIFFLLQILFSLSFPVSGLTFNGNELRDLESNTTYFQTETSYWAASNTVSPSIISSQCAGIWLLGGYGVTTTTTTFTRVYSSLPPHNSIYFSIFIWYIDLSQQVNPFEIYIDGQSTQNLNANPVSSLNSGSNICGGSTNDYVRLRIEGSLAHNSSSITFQITLKSDPVNNDFSLGFRELDLLFQIKSTPTTAICQAQTPGSGSGASCNCPLGQYDSSGSSGCTACSGSCRTCAGPSAQECTSCYFGSSFDGTQCFTCDASCFQCQGTGVTDCVRCGPGSFLYWNGTCQGSCVAPLVATSEGEYQKCSLPCGSATDFYFENSTCRASCPTRDFTQISYGDLKLCNFKCTGGSDYLYSNGSCLASCPSPFVSIIEGVERYCNFACPVSLDYLYENGSCYSNCDSPFIEVSQGVERYCNFPCEGSKYLYGNKSCDSACPSPFERITQGVEHYCNFPCSGSMSYLYSNRSCSSYCESSFLDISIGVEKYCNFPCSGSDYLYQNSSCDSNCLSPFIKRQQGTENFCNFPCEDSSYLYSNGSCYSYCESSFIEVSKGIEKYCNFPCDSSNYLYANGSCYSACPTPFNIITQASEKYCNFPCSNSEYLYENGSCYSSCEPFFIAISKGVDKYCNFPCSGSDYLYQNGTCHSTCQSPFSPIQKGIQNYCNFPCITPEYLYENGNCLSNCPYPHNKFLQGAEKYCNKPCPNKEYYEINTGKCNKTCQPPYKIVMLDSVQACKPHPEPPKKTSESLLKSIYKVSSVIGGIIRPNNMNSAFMVAITKLLKYTQYVDVPFSEEMRDNLHPNSTGGIFCVTQMFIFPMPESLKEKLPQHKMPPSIEQSGVHSSYLVNHWETMSSYLFLFVLAIVSSGLEKLVINRLPRRRILIAVMTRLRILLKWNFLLFAFFNTYDDLTFYAILEFKTLHLNSFLSVLSFLICLVMSSLAIFLLWKAWVSCKDSLGFKNKIFDENSASENSSVVFYKKWEDYQVLYAGLKRDSKIKQYYLFIYTVRIIVCYFIAAVFHEYPMVQTIQFLIWSLLMMFILLKYRPILDPFAYVVNIIYEVLILIVNLCLVILVACYLAETLSENLQYNLSKTILVSNFLMNFFSNVFSWVYIVTGTIAAYKVTKKKKNLNARTVWLSVPVSPYSNPGMDYDDLTYLENEKYMSQNVAVTLINPPNISKNKIAPSNLAIESDNEISFKNNNMTPHRDSLPSLVMRREISDTHKRLISSRQSEIIESPDITPRGDLESRPSSSRRLLNSQSNKRRNLNQTSEGSLLDALSSLMKKSQLMMKENDGQGSKKKEEEGENPVTINLDQDELEFNNENDDESLSSRINNFFRSPRKSQGIKPLNLNRGSILNDYQNGPSYKDLVIVESLDDSSDFHDEEEQKSQNFPVLDNTSPIGLLGESSQRGSLSATYLDSKFSPIPRNKSTFSKEAIKAGASAFQFQGLGESLALSFSGKSEGLGKFMPRRISRNVENSLMSMSRRSSSNIEKTREKNLDVVELK